MRIRMSLHFVVTFYLLLNKFAARGTKRSQFTVWLPSGRLIQLPCNLDREKYTSLSANPTYNNISCLLKPQLLDGAELGVTTVWYNAVGNILHVGEIIPLNLPMLAPGDMDYAFSRTASSRFLRKSALTLELPNTHGSEFGSSMDILTRATMSTITCKTFRSQTTGFVNTANPPQPRPFSLKEEIIYNQFSLVHYTQPRVIWNYAIPEGNSSISKLWKDETNSFCLELRNIREYQLSPCLSVTINPVPVEYSVSNQTNLTVIIDLSNNALSLLSNPTQIDVNDGITLPYLHALTKSALDFRLLRTVHANDSFATIYTSVETVCPTGTQLKHPPLTLRPLTIADYIAKNASLQSILPTESAYKLLNVTLTCEQCPAGYASKSPYGYGQCQPCPRGYYRGETGWPSTAGCLACPEGYGTLQEGSTSAENCLVDGGPFTRWVVSSAAWVYNNYMELIIAAYEVSKTYGRRAKIHMSPEKRKEEDAKAVLWINRIHPAALTLAVVYFLLILIFTNLCCYRVCLIYRYKKMHSKRLYLLRKSIIIGQLNSIDDVKDFMRQDYAQAKEITTLSEEVGKSAAKSENTTTK